MLVQTPKIFISYSRADSDFALKLGKDLRSARIDIWIDQLDVPLGDLWDRVTEEALENCESLIVILSGTSVNSENVMDEIAYALEEKKKIIPVLYESCKIPFRIRRFQRSNFMHSYDNGLQQLLNALNIQPSIAKPAAQNIEEETKPTIIKQEEKAIPSSQSINIPDIETEQKENDEIGADKSITYYKEAASKGNSFAQFKLGVKYDSGEGVQENKSEAFKWFKKSADQEHEDSMAWAGYYYENGYGGVSKNLSLAIDLYRKAALKDNAFAQFKLGVKYDSGEGVPENKSEAFKWFKKSADQGHEDAMAWVGYYYETGLAK